MQNEDFSSMISIAAKCDGENCANKSCYECHYLQEETLSNKQTSDCDRPWGGISNGDLKPWENT